MKGQVALLFLALVATGLAQQQDFIYEDYDFVCPFDNGFFPHDTQCDGYYACTDGLAEFRLCGNGLAFDDTDDTREHCNYKYHIDCGNRTELEPPITTPHCDYLYGIFTDPDDCAVFWSCWNGEASKYSCAPGLAYDRHSRVCTWMDKVPECQQKRADMQQGFVCPAPGELAVTGAFSRHPHPEDCRQYFVCLDGNAREYGCPLGTVFRIGDLDGTGQCNDPLDVPGCEDYYGELDLNSLSPAQVQSGRANAAPAAQQRPPTPRRPSTIARPSSQPIVHDDEEYVDVDE